MKLQALVASIFVLAGSAAAHGQDALANNTLLLIRHAEKPPDSAGMSGLTVVGQHRAEAYIHYFRPFHESEARMMVSALFAGADSESSIRPRLTLEPLSKASSLPLDATVSTKDPAALVALLRSRQHGLFPLVCWRHGQIPALLSAFGVSPKALLPDGKWPDDVYDWVIVIHFNAQGKAASEKLEHEILAVE